MLAVEPYIDTSALTKRYIAEPGSDDVDRFLKTWPRAFISRLVVVEFRCVLGRRLRAGELDPGYERAALADFADDVYRGHFQVEPLADRHAVSAYDLVGQLSGQSLRPLDALHLAIAQSLGAALLATADRGMALAAEALGITAVTFGQGAA